MVVRPGSSAAGLRMTGGRGPPPPETTDPGHAAGLQLGDDLVGDFGIEIGPVALAPVLLRCLDIAVLRDGRRGPLPRLPTRHGKPVRTPTLLNEQRTILFDQTKASQMIGTGDLSFPEEI